MTRVPALERLLRQLNNDFAEAVYRGTVRVCDGTLVQPVPKAGWYYRLCGSPADDGVYLCTASGALHDGEFSGAVYMLAIPPEVRQLAEDIEAWCAEHENTDYQSESFGGYTYTRFAGADGTPLRWQQVFRARMNPWRKL